MPERPHQIQCWLFPVQCKPTSLRKMKSPFASFVLVICLIFSFFLSFRSRVKTSEGWAQEKADGGESWGRGEDGDGVRKG